MTFVKRLWCWLFGHKENIGCLADPDAPMVLFCKRCYVQLEWPTTTERK